MITANVAALLMVPALPLYVGWIPALLPLGAFLGGALGVGYSGVTPVLTTSLFPEHVRGRAIGVVYHVGAMIGAASPVATAGLAGNTDLALSSSIAIVAGSALVLMAIAVIVLRREIVIAPQVTPVATPDDPTTVPLPRATVARSSAARDRQDLARGASTDLTPAPATSPPRGASTDLTPAPATSPPRPSSPATM
jgi:MFS family permease